MRMSPASPHSQSPAGASRGSVAADPASCASRAGIFKVRDRAADIDGREGPPPPAGLGIAFTSNGAEAGTLFIPKRGFRGVDAFSLLLVTIGMYFAYRNIDAPQDGGATFASLILVGFSIWGGVLTGSTETQELYLGADELSVSKKGFIEARKLTIPYTGIQAIDVQSFTPRSPFAMARYMGHFAQGPWPWSGIPLITLVHGKRKTRIAENLSEAESKRLVLILKAVVFKRTGRRV